MYCIYSLKVPKYLLFNFNSGLQIILLLKASMCKSMDNGFIYVCFGHLVSSAKCKALKSEFLELGGA